MDDRNSVDYAPGMLELNLDAAHTTHTCKAATDSSLNPWTALLFVLGPWLSRLCTLHHWQCSRAWITMPVSSQDSRFYTASQPRFLTSAARSSAFFVVPEVCRTKARLSPASNWRNTRKCVIHLVLVHSLFTWAGALHGCYWVAKCITLRLREAHTWPSNQKQPSRASQLHACPTGTSRPLPAHCRGS